MAPREILHPQVLAVIAAALEAYSLQTGVRYRIADIQPVDPPAQGPGAAGTAGVAGPAPRSLWCQAGRWESTRRWPRAGGLTARRS